MARSAAGVAARPRRTGSAASRRAPVVRRLGPGEALRRRLSGPAAPQRGARPAVRASAAGASVALPARVLRAPFARAARARTVGLLDRLLQGSAWIVLVGVLLAGIVFFNVDLLQLNRQIAHTSERAAGIKRQNAALQLQLARLGSSERIQRVAARRGLKLPAPGDVRYLRAHPRSDGGLAAARIVAPGSGFAPPVAAAPPAAEIAPPRQQAAAPQTTTTSPTAQAPAPTTTAPAGGGQTPTGGASPPAVAPAGTAGGAGAPSPTSTGAG